MSAGEALPEGLVQVSETGGGKFQQSVVAGSHRFMADEPVRFGGLDSGPGPYDLLLAALGSCTAMTIRLYAERKSIVLTHVSVVLRHQHVHEEDAEREGDTHLERITREIRLEGDLSVEERTRLLEIADRCPVHRTLDGRVEIRTLEVAG
jgi:putative redox protein